MIKFRKYHGAGNDFILIDETEFIYNDNELNEKKIIQLCDRRFGIGADGLMRLQRAESYDFRMIYYNADGKESSMCGNGGRCITRFAYDLGLISDHAHFIAIDGEHDAYITDKEMGIINLKMKDVDGIEESDDQSFLNTGSPHVVLFRKGIENIDVYIEGRKIRNSDKYAPNGTNVNFVEIDKELNITARTFERGVEGETLACGTGATAIAIASWFRNKEIEKPIQVRMRGGMLKVNFNCENGKSFNNIWLEGPTEHVFDGLI